MIHNRFIPPLPAVDRPGVARAAAVIVLWAVVQGLVLFAPAPALGILLVFLYTGLFITAHDAMHGTIAPASPRLNRAIGRLCAGLYAGFSFDHLRTRHLRHHATPATDADPDHHRGNAGLVPWYLRFMWEYTTVGQLLRASAIFWGLTLLLPPHQALVGWAAPALLSSVQLFVFGIWRVHREPEGGWGAEPLRARTERLPRWLSFLTCWHFGYHREHHLFPHLPWWRLPDAVLPS